MAEFRPHETTVGNVLKSLKCVDRLYGSGSGQKYDVFVLVGHPRIEEWAALKVTFSETPICVFECSFWVELLVYLGQKQTTKSAQYECQNASGG